MQQGQKVTRTLDLLRSIRNEASQEEEEAEKNPGRILIFSDTKRNGTSIYIYIYIFFLEGEEGV